jgi:protein ImuB
LWIAVTLPMLPLEAVRPPSPEADPARAAPMPPYALVVHARIVLADPRAQALGVRIGFARSHALALAPQLECLTPAPERESRAFEAVALALCAFTPQIVLADSHTLLLDVTASLRLFGGLRALWRQIGTTLDGTGHHTVLGCAPTPWAAWLFARAAAVGDGRRRRVVRPARLVAALDPLPATLLPAAALHGEGLAQIGCETLAAVRSLPRAGLVRRFGAGLLTSLAQTYGEAPDPRDYFMPPPVFEAKLELMARVEQAEALLFAVRRLLLQLVGWLTARHAGVSQFTLTLVHETARHGDPRSSALTVSWSTPARALDHLLLMSREKLHRTELIAPVIELHLSADQVSDYAAPTETLFPLAAGPDGEREAMVRLIERLVARLGADKVREVAARADHRPEAVVSTAPYLLGKRATGLAAQRASKARQEAQANQTSVLKQEASANQASASKQEAQASQAWSLKQGVPANQASASKQDVPSPQALASRQKAMTRQALAMKLGTESRQAMAARQASASSASSPVRKRLNGRLAGPGNLVPPLVPVAPRPVWLMPVPLRLTTRHGLPYYRSTLQIVSGPECIEAGWWDGQGATRDYFIASSDDAALYWVYRERSSADEPHGAAWFLHGLFG